LERVNKTRLSTFRKGLVDEGAGGTAGPKEGTWSALEDCRGQEGEKGALGVEKEGPILSTGLEAKGGGRWRSGPSEVIQGIEKGKGAIVGYTELGEGGN